MLPVTHSFTARLALQQGDGASAQRWVQSAYPSPTHQPLIMLEIPQITLARILLAGDTAAKQEAMATLVQLRKVAEETNNTMRLIELLALQALAEEAHGYSEQSLTTLGQAVMLAKPGGFVRTFVDLGPPMATLLFQLVAADVEPVFVGRILAAFPPALDDPRKAQVVSQTDLKILIEPLTEREVEVLALLAAHLANKEIARILTISPLTVRTHTTNIYQKLGVNSLKKAVARAQALGLVPSHTPPQR